MKAPPELNVGQMMQREVHRNIACLVTLREANYPTGRMVAARIRIAIDNAERAMASNEIDKIIKAYRALKETE
jgi:hypothetical protein